MNKKFVMIGSGAMGTAVAKVIVDAGKVDVAIYGIDRRELNDLERGENTRYFPKSVKLPKFKTYSNIVDALDGADYIAIAVPSKIYNIVLKQILKNIKTKAIIINVSKGFYPGTDFSIHEGIESLTKNNPLVTGVLSLIGPCFASELVQEMPSTLAIVARNKEFLISVQDIFQNSYFRTYMQTDVIGAEVGAAYKNVIAISTGLAKGLGYGINTIAALITRGLNEMKKFNKVMGGKDSTLMTLTGIGDLIVTATSELSRNFSFGKQIAINKKKALVSTQTIEGLTALSIICKIGDANNLELPIAQYLYNIIYNDLDPKEVVKDLFTRKLKSE